MKKIRIKVRVPQSRSEAEAVLEQVRLLAIRRQRLMLDREEAVAQIDARVKPALDELEEQLTGMTAVLEDWADGNAQEFGDKKSLACLHGEMGWRMGNPTLKPIKGWTWDRVLERLKQRGDVYVRRVEEVNKETILSDRESLGAEVLGQMGVYVSQKNTFWVQPKLDEPETK